MSAEKDGYCFFPESVKTDQKETRTLLYTEKNRWLNA
jgi:hypothetical protein